jgi:hypothetical protein
MRRVAAWAAILMLSVGWPCSVFAYLKLGANINGQIVDVSWRQQPIRYFVNERDVPGVTNADLRGAIGRATATWQAVSSANVRFEFAGTTTSIPADLDGRTTLGFLDRPELDRVLGATSFLIDMTNGNILEADVFFNSHFEWSASAQGEAGRVDIESVALHELGHLLGLGHSALGETELTPGGGRRVIASGSVMFPIALSAGAIADRRLQADDIAGISNLYPAAGEVEATGSIVGHVRRDGQGIYGVHVVAFNPETGALVGGFSLNINGDFVIGSLTPGPYLLRAEPLDDANPDAFFSVPIDVDVRVGYAQAMVVAPRGGSSGTVDIRVTRK